MRFLFFALLVIPFFAHSQKEGIYFSDKSSWKDILQRAKAEKKFIFVDCYTTWCGPCKRMEKVVYPNDSVGAAINSRFISVKLQMDTSKSDGIEVKQWYGIAHNFGNMY